MRLRRTARLAAAALTGGVLAAAAGCAGSAGGGSAAGGTATGAAPPARAGTLYELDPATGAIRYSLSLGTPLPHFASLSMTGSRAYLRTNDGVVAVAGA